MGRGRAKAKQTKVARQLKYGGPTTDLERLQAELAGSSTDEHDEVAGSEEVVDYDDPYAKYVVEDDGDGDGDDEAQPVST